jgi:hypothetical protein
MATPYGPFGSKFIYQKIIVYVVNKQMIIMKISCAVSKEKF